VRREKIRRFPVEEIGQVARHDREERHVRNDEEEHPEPERGRQHRAPGLGVVSERVERDRHRRRRLPLVVYDLACVCEGSTETFSAVRRGARGWRSGFPIRVGHARYIIMRAT